MKPALVVLTGSAHPALARQVAALGGGDVCRAQVGSFRDGETRVRIEEDVRGHDVFVIQSVSQPVNHHLMELLLLMDAARRAAARRVTAVVPYFAYARQERRANPGEPISARLVAGLIEQAGADRVVVLDLHADAIEGFFRVPVEHLSAVPLLAAHYASLRPAGLVIAAPDEGSVERAVGFRSALGGSPGFAVLMKQRPEPDVTEVVGLVGEQAVQGQTVVLVDDIISTGGTLIEASEFLIAHGARSVSAVVTHAVLAAKAPGTLSSSPLTEIVVTDSVPIPEERRFEKLRVLSVDRLLADALSRIHDELL